MSLPCPGEGLDCVWQTDTRDAGCDTLPCPRIDCDCTPDVSDVADASDVPDLSDAVDIIDLAETSEDDGASSQIYLPVDIQVVWTGYYRETDQFLHTLTSDEIGPKLTTTWTKRSDHPRSSRAGRMISG